MNLVPVQTQIKSGAKFCSVGHPRTAIFINSDAEMSPNRRVKDEIRIALFGGKEKTRILHEFLNNGHENLNIAPKQDESSIQIEIDKSLNVKIIIFDSSNVENNPALKNDFYQF